MLFPCENLWLTYTVYAGSSIYIPNRFQTELLVKKQIKKAVRTQRIDTGGHRHVVVYLREMSSFLVGGVSFMLSGIIGVDGSRRFRLDAGRSLLLCRPPLYAYQGPLPSRDIYFTCTEHSMFKKYIGRVTGIACYIPKGY